MSINLKALIEFSFHLIDVQIEKYTKLAQVGVGPDAKVSAALIHAQVQDLLAGLDTLMHQKNPLKEEIRHYAQTVRFYLDCEYLRGRAGWLLDDNTIHNTVYNRVSKQMVSFERQFPNLEKSHVLTDLQHQFEHDSHAIAFRILDLVKRLKEDPDRTDLGSDNALGHGLVIMRKHARASARYSQEPIASELEERHSISQSYLKHSPFSKSTAKLEKDQAIEYSQHDRLQLDQLKTMHKTHNRPTTLCQYGMFAAGAIVAAATAVTLYHHATSEENTAFHF